MLHIARHYQKLMLLMIFIGVLPYSMLTRTASARPQTVQPAIDPVIPALIHRQKYDDAITRLEQILEREPQNGEALTYLATANLYQNLKFLDSQREFTEAFKAGGGATFVVAHSHEKFTTDDLVDYCRGWLHLRRGNVEFVTTESTHGFKINFTQVQEFKRNKLSKRAFHIKVDGKSINFRGRSNTEFEALLIIALYKSFIQT